MRIIIALLLSLPVYYAVGSVSPALFCLIALQVMAGLSAFTVTIKEER